MIEKTALMIARRYIFTYQIKQGGVVWIFHFLTNCLTCLYRSKLKSPILGYSFAISYHSVGFCFMHVETILFLILQGYII